MVLQSVLEPVLFASESDQDSGRPAMPGDENFAELCQTQNSGEVVFHLGEGELMQRGSRVR